MSGVQTCSAVALRPKSGTIDSDRSNFDTNSTVLSIPASQGVPGRRKEKAMHADSRTQLKSPSAEVTAACTDVSATEVRFRVINDARAIYAPRSVGYRSGVGSACFVRALRRPANSYLVDPASSHMLVSKIKPCMSKHKL